MSVHQATLAALRAKNIERVEVQFSGGNDEGGAEVVEVTPEDGETFSLNVWGNDDRGNLANIFEQLQEPIYERYYSFAGDFYVYGKLIWDVGAGTCYFEGEESAYVPIAEIDNPRVV